MLRPHKACRATEAGEITELNASSVLRLGLHAATPTSDDDSGRLDRDHHFRVGLENRKNAKPV